MPPGKSAQSNASLYTAITFVALFLIAATAAIIFYLKYEDQKVLASEADAARNEVISRKEYQDISKTIGKKPDKGRTYTAALLEYFSTLDQLITGEISESTAAMKVETIRRKVNSLNIELGDDSLGVFGKDGVDLIFTIRDLKNKLDLERQAVAKLNEALDEVQAGYDIEVDKANETKDALTKEVDRWQKRSDEIQTAYDDIKKLSDLSTEEQVQTYMDRYEKAKESLRQTIDDLDNTKIELAKTTEELQLVLKQRQETMPQPDREVAAFRPDAKVTSVDLDTETVFLSIGSNDHVYAGLTFMIFDKNNPSPKDGKGKAEIDVFHVGSHVSAARIITSDKRNPITQDDLAVNLIWDSKTSNKFVVIGDFDFNGDELIDKNGKEKIEQLIERWGGKISDTVSIDTDFIVFGSAPEIPSKPTLDQIERDPTLESKYNEAIERNRKYAEVFKQAEKLDVPTFNRTRFFNLIGYETNAKKASPF